MSAMTATAPDLQAIKARQQKTWASGDYSAVAATIPLISEQLCDAADLRAGWRVLDVAGGSGNTALAAARCGCDVVSLDYVPSLLERARERSIAEGLPIETIEGRRRGAALRRRLVRRGRLGARRDVRARSRAGGRRDAARLPPRRHDRARQLDAGRLHRGAVRHGRRPRAAAGRADAPPRWGTEEHVRALMGDGVRTLRMTRRSFTFRSRSP